jgi:hypothetical protein
MAEFGEHDVLAWELEQVRLLKELSPVYGPGWEVGGKLYNARLKLIQKQSASRIKAQIATRRIGSSASSQKMSIESERLPAPLGWEAKSNQRKDGRAFNDFKEAMIPLLGAAPYESWKIDRDAPSGTGWRRYISTSKSNPDQYARRRIVQVKGFTGSTTFNMYACCM